MYDVLYLDKQRSAGVVASHLERQSAIEVARAEARRRHAARMFAAGSATTPRQRGADRRVDDSSRLRPRATWASGRVYTVEVAPREITGDARASAGRA